MLPGVKQIELVTGQKYLMCNGYTYRFQSRLRKGEVWRCTNTKKCWARIKMCEDGLYLQLYPTGQHCHPRPLLVMDEDGKYTRVTAKRTLKP